MSKKILTKHLDSFISAEKKYKSSILQLRKELKETGISLKTICKKIEVPYSVIGFQFRTKKMPLENFRKLTSFLE